MLQNFLASLNPPIVIPSGKKVTRWHPQFRLDEVPDIPAAPLPAAPESNKMCNTTAKDIISKAQDMLQCANPRMKKALEDLTKKTTAADSKEKDSIEKVEVSSRAPSHDLIRLRQEPNPCTSSSIRSGSEPAANRLAATKDAIAKAQQALLKKAKADPRMTKALHDILAKNNKTVNLNVEETIGEKKKEPQIQIRDGSSSQQKPKQEAQVTVNKTAAGNNKIAFGALKGISQSLLDKVRLSN